MSKETVAIIGGGGRESALADVYSRSPYVKRIIATPGNDMMQESSSVPVETFPHIKTSDTVGIGILLGKREQEIAYADIAQEDAIRWDLRGQLRLHRIESVGPSAEAGEIEWDKHFSRSFGDYFKLPQPKYDVLAFDQLPYGKNFPKYYEEIISKYGVGKYFVKASGLAQGKGVIGASGRDEIEKAIQTLRRDFPDASKKILIEEALIGEEFSAFAVSNGKSFKVIGFAQDHKRAYDGDLGPNTGGMGAVSNPLLLDDENLKQGVEDIFKKTFDGLQNGGSPYKGILYLGGMAVKEEGKLNPYVIEFNARWGDPEAQVLVPGLEVDLFELGQRINHGDFKNYQITSDRKVRVAVAIASNGYPGDYSGVRGKQIFGIEDARGADGVTVYGAGVKVVDGKHYIDGGRLLYVVGKGDNIIEARLKAYEGVDKIKTDTDGDLYHRKDIGWRDVARLRKDSV